MIVLYSIVLVVALLGAVACCYYIVWCSDDIDRSDAYKYDPDDYMDITKEGDNNQH